MRKPDSAFMLQDPADGGLQGVSPGRNAHSELELGLGAESLEQPRPPATQGLQRLAQLSYHSAWL